MRVELPRFSANPRFQIIQLHCSSLTTHLFWPVEAFELYAICRLLPFSSENHLLQLQAHFTGRGRYLSDSTAFSTKKVNYPEIQDVAMLAHRA